MGKKRGTSDLALLGKKSVRSEPNSPISFRYKGESIVTPFFVFSGLVLLVLIADVTLLRPLKSPDGQKNWVSNHQAGRNFLMAKKMIVKLLPSTAEHWSTDLQCGEVGHGVWFATGTVSLESSFGMEIPVEWKVLYLPATAQPLYLSIGSQSEGDLAAALSMAGIHSGPP